MALSKSAGKAFDRLALAEKKVSRLYEQCGALLARPFVNSGLYRLIETEVDAAVAFERLTDLLRDEKERSALRGEVAKRNGAGTRRKNKKAAVANSKSAENASAAAS